MGLVNSLFVGIFAAKVANYLIDLGIDVDKLDQMCQKILYEIERDRRKDLSPQEAASYFFGAAFSNMSPDCYLLPALPADIANRATVIMDGWVNRGKMKRQWLDSIRKTLRDQLSEDEDYEWGNRELGIYFKATLNKLRIFQTPHTNQA